MKVITDCEQGSERWHQLRLGSIGGSSISSVVAGGQGKTRKSLLYRKAGEILSETAYESYSNAHMERGLEQESDARVAYEWEMDCNVEQVALIQSDQPFKHDSPDGLVGLDGRIEIKCVIPSVHIETIISDKIPAAYRKQIQWGLFIDERDWCDFVSYSPLVKDRPTWIKRAYRDDKVIKELNDGADKFITELLMIVERIKNEKGRTDRQ